MLAIPGSSQRLGEIVAYIDDDAYPDPDWLKYLAATFLHSAFIAAGGPNLPPCGDGWVADCVANSPGGPIHVMLTESRGRTHSRLQHGLSEVRAA